MDPQYYHREGGSVCGLTVVAARHGKVSEWWQALSEPHCTVLAQRCWYRRTGWRDPRRCNLASLQRCCWLRSELWAAFSGNSRAASGWMTQFFPRVDEMEQGCPAETGQSSHWNLKRTHCVTSPWPFLSVHRRTGLTHRAQRCISITRCGLDSCPYGDGACH